MTKKFTASGVISICLVFTIENDVSNSRVPFNLLYDAGANPEVSYVDGGWEHEAETRETLYEYLAGFGEVPQEKWERFTRNCDIRIEKTSEGTYRYFAPTQMYVLGWDPNQLSI